MQLAEHILDRLSERSNHPASVGDVTARSHARPQSRVTPSASSRCALRTSLTGPTGTHSPRRLLVCRRIDGRGRRWAPTTSGRQLDPHHPDNSA